MQADLIAHYLGTVSAMVASYGTHLEAIWTFSQIINHANYNASHEKGQHKAL